MEENLNITQIDPNTGLPPAVGRSENRGFGTNFTGDISKYDYQFRTTTDPVKRQAERYENQSAWDATKRGVARFTANAALGIVKGITDIPDAVYNFAQVQAGTPENMWTNPLSAELDKLMKGVSESMPIYTNPYEQFDPGSMNWWMSHSDSLASAAGYIIPSKWIAGGTVKLLGALNAAATTGKGLRAAQATGALVAAAYTTSHEALGSIQQLYPQIYEGALKAYNGDETKAREFAAKQASQMYTTNLLNIIPEAIGISKLLKTPLASRNLIGSFGARSASIFASEAIPEAFQEAVNVFSEKQAIRNTDIIRGKESLGYTVVGDLIRDKDAWTSMLMGAAGGSVFQRGGKAMQAMGETESKVAKPFAAIKGFVTAATDSELALRGEQKGIIAQQTELNNKMMNVAKSYNETMISAGQAQELASITGDTELQARVDGMLTVNEAFKNFEKGTTEVFEKTMNTMIEVAQQTGNTELEQRATKMLEQTLSMEKHFNEVKETYPQLNVDDRKQYVMYEAEVEQLQRQISEFEKSYESVLSRDKHGIYNLTEKDNEKLERLAEINEAIAQNEALLSDGSPILDSSKDKDMSTRAFAQSALKNLNAEKAKLEKSLGQKPSARMALEMSKKNIEISSIRKAQKDLIVKEKIELTPLEETVKNLYETNVSENRLRPLVNAAGNENLREAMEDPNFDTDEFIKTRDFNLDADNKQALQNKLEEEKASKQVEFDENRNKAIQEIMANDSDLNLDSAEELLDAAISMGDGSVFGDAFQAIYDGFINANNKSNERISEIDGLLNDLNTEKTRKSYGSTTEVFNEIIETFLDTLQDVTTVTENKLYDAVKTFETYEKFAEKYGIESDVIEKIRERLKEGFKALKELDKRQEAAQNTARKEYLDSFNVDREDKIVPKKTDTSELEAKLIKAFADNGMDPKPFIDVLKKDVILFLFSMAVNNLRDTTGFKLFKSSLDPKDLKDFVPDEILDLVLKIRDGQRNNVLGGSSKSIKTILAAEAVLAISSKPFYQQLVAIRELVAMFFNKDIDYMYLQGVAGSGKSKIVTKYVVEIIKKLDSKVKIAAVAPGEHANAVITKSLFGTSEQVDHFENEASITKLVEALKSQKVNLLVVDEVGKLSVEMLEFLNNAIKDTVIKILFTGDPNQRTDGATFPLLNFASPFRGKINSTQALNISQRSGNYDILSAQKVFLDSGGTQVKQLKVTSNTNSTQGVEGLGLGEFIAKVKERLSKKDGKSRLLIIDDDMSKDSIVAQFKLESSEGIMTISEYKNKVLTVSESQGLEADEVFIYMNYRKSKNDLQDNSLNGRYYSSNVDLYVALSRAINYAGLYLGPELPIETVKIDLEKSETGDNKLKEKFKKRGEEYIKELNEMTGAKPKDEFEKAREENPAEDVKDTTETINPETIPDDIIPEAEAIIPPTDTEEDFKEPNVVKTPFEVAKDLLDAWREKEIGTKTLVIFSVNENVEVYVDIINRGDQQTVAVRVDTDGKSWGAPRVTGPIRSVEEILNDLEYKAENDYYETYEMEIDYSDSRVEKIEEEYSIRLKELEAKFNETADVNTEGPTKKIFPVYKEMDNVKVGDEVFVIYAESPDFNSTGDKKLVQEVYLRRDEKTGDYIQVGKGEIITDVKNIDTQGNILKSIYPAAEVEGAIIRTDIVTKASKMKFTFEKVYSSIENKLEGLTSKIKGLFTANNVDPKEPKVSVIIVTTKNRNDIRKKLKNSGIFLNEDNESVKLGRTFIQYKVLVYGNKPQYFYIPTRAQKYSSQTEEYTQLVEFVNDVKTLNKLFEESKYKDFLKFGDPTLVTVTTSTGKKVEHSKHNLAIRVLKGKQDQIDEIKDFIPQDSIFGKVSSQLFVEKQRDNKLSNSYIDETSFQREDLLISGSKSRTLDKKEQEDGPYEGWAIIKRKGKPDVFRTVFTINHQDKTFDLFVVDKDVTDPSHRVNIRRYKNIDQEIANTDINRAEKNQKGEFTQYAKDLPFNLIPEEVAFYLYGEFEEEISYDNGPVQVALNKMAKSNKTPFRRDGKYYTGKEKNPWAVGVHAKTLHEGEAEGVDYVEILDQMLENYETYFQNISLTDITGDGEKALQKLETAISDITPTQLETRPKKENDVKEDVIIEEDVVEEDVVEEPVAVEEDFATESEGREGLNGVKEIIFSNPNFKLFGFNIEGNYWNVVTSLNRAKVLVDINGVIVPFYLTTGQGGKDLIPGWYPFFGIGNDGWMNKTNRTDMESYYEKYWGKETSKIIESIAKELNDFYGTNPDNFKSDGDPNATSKPLTSLSEKVEDYINSNLSFTPTSNGKQAMAALKANLEQLGKEINDALSSSEKSEDVLSDEDVLDDIDFGEDAKEEAVVEKKIINDEEDDFEGFEDIEFFANLEAQEVDFDLQLNGIVEYIKKMFPFLPDDIIKTMPLSIMQSRKGKDVFGYYKNGISHLATQNGKVSSMVLRHETFHLFFNRYLTPAQRETMLRVTGRSSKYKQWIEVNKLTDNEENQEEYLAYSYMRKNWNFNNYSSPVLQFMHNMFVKIRNYVQSAFDFFMLEDSDRIIQKLFRDINSGKFDRVVNNVSNERFMKDMALSFKAASTGMALKAYKSSVETLKNYFYEEMEGGDADTITKFTIKVEKNKRGLPVIKDGKLNFGTTYGKLTVKLNSLLNNHPNSRALRNALRTERLEVAYDLYLQNPGEISEGEFFLISLNLNGTKLDNLTEAVFGKGDVQVAREIVTHFIELAKTNKDNYDETVANLADEIMENNQHDNEGSLTVRLKQFFALVPRTKPRKDQDRFINPRKVYVKVLSYLADINNLGDWNETQKLFNNLESEFLTQVARERKTDPRATTDDLDILKRLKEIWTYANQRITREGGYLLNDQLITSRNGVITVVGGKSYKVDEDNSNYNAVLTVIVNDIIKDIREDENNKQKFKDSKQELRDTKKKFKDFNKNFFTISENKEGKLVEKLSIPELAYYINEVYMKGFYVDLIANINYEMRQAKTNPSLVSEESYYEWVDDEQGNPMREKVGESYRLVGLTVDSIATALTNRFMNNVINFATKAPEMFHKILNQEINGGEENANRRILKQVEITAKILELTKEQKKQIEVISFKYSDNDKMIESHEKEIKAILNEDQIKIFDETKKDRFIVKKKVGAKEKHAFSSAYTKKLLGLKWYHKISPSVNEVVYEMITKNLDKLNTADSIRAMFADSSSYLNLIAEDLSSQENFLSAQNYLDGRNNRRYIWVVRSFVYDVVNSLKKGKGIVNFNSKRKGADKSFLLNNIFVNGINTVLDYMEFDTYKMKGSLLKGKVTKNLSDNHYYALKFVAGFLETANNSGGKYYQFGIRESNRNQEGGVKINVLDAKGLQEGIDSGSVIEEAISNIKAEIQTKKFVAEKAKYINRVNGGKDPETNDDSYYFVKYGMTFEQFYKAYDVKNIHKNRPKSFLPGETLAEFIERIRKDIRTDFKEFTEEWVGANKKLSYLNKPVNKFLSDNADLIETVYGKFTEESTDTDRLEAAYTAWWLQNYVNGFHLDNAVFGSHHFTKNSEDHIKREQGIRSPGKPILTGKDFAPTTSRMAVFKDTERTKNAFNDLKNLYSRIHGVSYEITDAGSFILPSALDELQRGTGDYSLGEVIKNIVFYIDPVSGVPVYIKTASFVITPELEKHFPELKAIADQMRSPGVNVNHFVPASAFKVGAPDDQVKNGEAIKPHHVRDLYYQGYKIQSNPVHGHEGSRQSNPSQFNYFLNVNYKNLETAKIVYNADSTIADLQFQLFNLESEVIDKDGVVNKENLVKRILESLGDSESDNRIVDLVKLGKLSHNFPSLVGKFIIQTANIFSKNSLEVKHTGNKLVVQPSLGIVLFETPEGPVTFDDLSDLDKVKATKFFNLPYNLKEFLKEYSLETFNEFEEHIKNGVEYKKLGPDEQVLLQSIRSNPEEYLLPRKLKMRTEDNYTEVIMPKWWLDEQGLTDGEYIYDSIKSRTGVAVRIPTTGIHSAIPIRVIASPTKTNLVIVPEEIVPLHGSDFDVDSLFYIRRETVSAKERIILDESYFDFVEAQNVKLRAIKDRDPEIRASKRDVLVAEAKERKETYPYGLVGYKEGVFDKEMKDKIFSEIARNPSNKNYLKHLLGLAIKITKNEKIDAYLSIITDPKNAEDMNTPIEFTAIKADIFSEISAGTTDIIAALEDSEIPDSVRNEVEAFLKKDGEWLDPATWLDLKALADKENPRFIITNEEIKKALLDSSLGVVAKLKIISQKVSLKTERNVFRAGDNLKYHKDNFGGVSGTGIQAEIMKMVAYFQYAAEVLGIKPTLLVPGVETITYTINDVKISETKKVLKPLKIVFDGIVYDSLEVYTKVGKVRTTELGDTVLNGYIDNVKEQITSIINANGHTITTIGTMIAIGIDIDTITYFMNQPIIRHITSNPTGIDSKTKKFLKTNSRLVKQLEEDDRVLREKEKAEELSITISTKNKTIRGNIDKNTLISNIKLDTRWEDIEKNDQFILDQLQVLKTFRKLKSVAEKLSDNAKYLSILKDLPIEHHEMIATLEKNTSQDLVADITQVPNIKAADNALRRLINVITQMFFLYSDKYNDYFNNLLFVYNFKLDKSGQDMATLGERAGYIRRELEKYIMSGVTKLDPKGFLGFDEKGALTRIPEDVEVFIGPKEAAIQAIIDETVEYKGRPEVDNLFLDYVVSKPDNDGNRRLNFSAGTNLDPDFKLALTEAYLALPKELKQGLLKYAAVVDGAAFGFKSFTNLIPPTESAPGEQDGLDFLSAKYEELLNNLTNADLEIFEAQFSSIKRDAVYMPKGFTMTPDGLEYYYTNVSPVDLQSLPRYISNRENTYKLERDGRYYAIGKVSSMYEFGVNPTTSKNVKVDKTKMKEFVKKGSVLVTGQYTTNWNGTITILDSDGVNVGYTAEATVTDKGLILQSPTRAQLSKVSQSKPINLIKLEKTLQLLKKNTGADYVTDPIEFKKAVKETGYKGIYPAGFVYKGKVYINTTGEGNMYGADTALHEYAHLYINALKEKNPALYARILALAKKTGYYESVKAAYSELKGSDLLEEVAATYIGIEGKSEPGLLYSIKRFLRSIGIEAFTTLGDLATDLLTSNVELANTELQIAMDKVEKLKQKMISSGEIKITYNELCK